MIEANKLVGSLKDAIKEKMRPTFDHISANPLNLWGVSTSDIHSLNNLDFANVPSLSPLVILSKVFSDVLEQHVHVVVEVPTNCMCLRYQVPRYCIADDFIVRHFHSARHSPFFASHLITTTGIYDRLWPMLCLPQPPPIKYDRSTTVLSNS